MSNATSRDNQICVLAPWPLLTVTIESPVGGQSRIHVHAGGQGFWVARMIANLGGRPVLCGPIGGETGLVVRALVQAEGVELRAVDTEGWNGCYVHDRRPGERKTIAEMPSPSLTRHEYDNLYDTALTAGLKAGVAVLTGVPDEKILPGKFFRRLALDLGHNGVTVVADLSGSALKALEGGISFLKVSHQELIDAGYCVGNDRPSLLTGLSALKTTGAGNAIVSCASDPALARLGERLFEVRTPRFEPLDHRGAGDSMTAALAMAAYRGLDPEEMLRLAAAAGALNVTRHGLGTGNMTNIEEVARQVTVKEIGTSS